MGNGIILPDNLNESITNRLTEEYKRLSEANVEESLIREKLASLYKQLLSDQVTAPETSPTASSHDKMHISLQIPIEVDDSGNDAVLKQEKLVTPHTERKTPIVRSNRTNSLRMEIVSPKINSVSNGFAFADRTEGSNSKSNTPSHKERHTIVTAGATGKPLLVRKKSYRDATPRYKRNTIVTIQASDHDVDEKEDGDKLTDIISPTAAIMSETKDNWDSVSKQPYCSTCNMAFRSAAFLERHIKFSELHLKTLEEIKLEQELNSSETGTNPNLSAIRSPSIARLSFRQNQKAVDGVDYRQIYHGVKFYWRTKENIDFDIYFHIKSHLIEVVPYDSVKGKELKRLYFNGDVIHRMIENDVLVAVEEKIKELSTDRFAVIPPRNIIFTEMQQHTSVTYLLARLQQVESEIAFVSNSSTGDASPFIASPPLSLLPVTVVRRRLTGVEEFKPLSPHDMLLTSSTPKVSTPTVKSSKMTFRNIPLTEEPIYEEMQGTVDNPNESSLKDKPSQLSPIKASEA